MAKIGLDGHDRGVKVLARGLRDAGMEVIYTGLWQTPAAAAKAAIEEDVDVLGASFHSAAHMTLVPVLKNELAKLGRPDIPVAIGGIIPHDDVQPMKDAGCALVFETEVSMATIVSEINKLAAKTHEHRATNAKNGRLDGWLADLPKGNRAALGQLLTWVENGACPDDIAAKLPAVSKEPVIAGFTGAPGVGKSTLIGRVIRELRDRNKTVGVLAVDPVSPITGGALLGDRARMTMVAADEGVFLRSSASRGELGGLAPTTGAMIEVMKRSNIDVLLIETVGAGQNDFTVRQWASPLVLLLMPGAGDDLQLEKAGIIEVAEVFVINKADLPGAGKLEAQIRETLGSSREIVQTVASHGEGIDILVDSILGFKKH
ncbi:MAG: cobalamin B12-binding domain-containing protein [Phycisphaerales bacterium]|nr:cobalamin B12-binding domain-containing protein [Phycisphaerales bacterium]MCB9856049.1 cobalamin B12-binding domain-containing protein [Phycisphaerales bacterium]MCB9863923.1 cobalamin B12-binding domain-containing protein [Phycisphaerales bacterium]